MGPITNEVAFRIARCTLKVEFGLPAVQGS